MFNTKCLFLFLFIYRKNLVESADTSAGASPSHGPAPASTNSGSYQGSGTRKDAKAGSSSTADPKTASTGTPGSSEDPKKDGKTSSVASPEDTGTGQSAKTGTQQSSTPATRTGTQQSSTPATRTGQSASSPPAGGASLTSGGSQAARNGQTGSAQAARTGSQQPSSPPAGGGTAARTGTQGGAGSPPNPTSCTDNSAKLTTPAANLSGSSPTKEGSDTDSSSGGGKETSCGGSGGAGSPASTTGASPTSGTDDKAKASVTTKKTGVEVCIKNNNKATDQFDYKKDNNVVTYSTKEDYGFKLVKQKNIEIWKAKDEKGYARKVVLKGKGKGEKTVTVYMPLGTTDQFRKEGKGKPWNVAGQPGNQPATKKSSSIGSSDTWDKIKGWLSGLNCSGCSCGSSTSTAPDNHSPDISPRGGTNKSNLIGSSTSDGSSRTGGSTHTDGASQRSGGSAKAGGTTSQSNGSSGTHTSSEKAKESGTGTGTRTGGSAQGGGTRTSPDGTSQQGGTASSQPNQHKGAQQTGTSQSTLTELQQNEYPKNIKLFKVDPNDNTKTIELTSNEYKVKKMDNEHLYEFNEGVNCTLIKRDDKDVWTYDSSKSNSKYPDGFSFERFIFIYFNGCTDVYDKIDNEWVLCVSLRLYINKPDVVDSGQLDLAEINKLNSEFTPLGQIDPPPVPSFPKIEPKIALS
ncbi:uncharacterized protein TOT_030000729 [Theileria orientalis strain Shintoku]|uniref:SfiI-subtelomeric related protein family member n=1 Tax=Theileria orientalis strain Shintoku TaxID=869250 RepID=J4CDN8_THEOR|nr:uncharacterized protein TOT_030000729 [Theileria orientalis strain Shintoku]BAM41467.1 uncharacterized protein TOT_030000729 [Theileria orientalis strain Shintoku]|eukprot:XP_009691768.1 uncharacterized protein TOT_030000729 [Theileria orientalis strain Shintoku]